MQHRPIFAYVLKSFLLWGSLLENILSKSVEIIVRLSAKPRVLSTRPPEQSVVRNVNETPRGGDTPSGRSLARYR